MMARVSRADWIKRVERWGDSGLTAKQFAVENGVSPQSLTFWKWKLRREAGAHAHVEDSRAKSSRADARPTTTFLQLLPTIGRRRAGRACWSLCFRMDSPYGFRPRSIRRR
jgi:hypothetical protein